MAGRGIARRPVLGALVAGVLLAGCGIGGADVVALDGAPEAAATSTPDPAPDPELVAQLEADLTRWKNFPVEADPRPIVLLRPVQDSPEGFSNGTTKDDFAYGRWADPRDLPEAPAEVDGYPVMGAAEALDALRRTEGDGVQSGRSELRVKDVWLDEADVDTDRGVRRLPAWFVTFDGARGESIVPAVATSARWVEAEGGPSSRDMVARVDPSGRVLTLPFDSRDDACTRFPWHLHMRESPQAVVIRIVQQSNAVAVSPTCPDGGQLLVDRGPQQTSDVVLAAPLGNRLLMWEGDPIEVLDGPPAAAGAPSTGPGHVCIGTKGPPPGPGLSYAAQGHEGNQWTVPVGEVGGTVRFTITQPQGTEVTRLWFAILSDKAFEDGVIRTFPNAGEDWAPGEHTATVTWDGRDDDGGRVAPGRYRLVGNAITNSSREVRCNDGSGSGVEVSTGSLEGAGVGSFRVGG